MVIMRIICLLLLLLMMLVVTMEMRMLRDSAAVSLVLVATAVRHVRIAPLRTVETVVPLTVNVDETGAVLGAERLYRHAHANSNGI